MREWEAIVPEFDRLVYAKGGLGASRAFGQRPALLIVDVVESWTGSRPMDVLSAIQEYKTACGESAWTALPRIRELLEASRAAQIPIVFTRGDVLDKAHVGDSTKRLRTAEEARRIAAAPISPMIEPRPGEYQLEKAKASAFFGTPLATYLIQRGVDCLLVAGTATSGCVRASVLDAHSYGFTVFVIEECVFDRSPFLHQVNLFELDAKYADVIPLDRALGWLTAYGAVRTETNGRPERSPQVTSGGRNARGIPPNG